MQAKFVHLLVMFVITAGLPFRAIENPYFIGMCRLLMGNSGVSFVIPKRRSLKRFAQQKAEFKEKK
jgi:hypothetical protein